MSGWRINHESVSHELLNGEVVAIHLGTGVYYSLRGPAAAIWQRLATPADLAGIVQALKADFDVETAQAVPAVADFVQRLRGEDLIVEEAVPAGVGTVPAAAVRRPFVAPELERFADLQDLLLLDPIHDVGAQGWPHRPAGPGKQP